MTDRLFTESQVREALCIGIRIAKGNPLAHEIDIDLALSTLTPVQSPGVPSNGHDIVDLWRKTSEPIWDDIDTANGEWKRLSDMIDQAIFTHLPQEQKPVVPTSSELADIIASAKREYNVLHGSKALPNYAMGETGQPLVFAADFIGEKIRAHLLAHGWREGMDEGVNHG